VNERSWGNNMKKIYFFAIFIFVNLMSLDSFAQQCGQEKRNGVDKCSEAKFNEYTEDLAETQAKIKALNSALSTTDGVGGSVGVGQNTTESMKGLERARDKHIANIAQCTEAIRICKESCEKEAANNKAQQNYTAAEQNKEDKKHCETDLEQKKEQAKVAEGSMGKALETLGGLLSALGIMAPKQQDVAQPLCVQNPNDPTCTTDTANKESNSQLATGDFRRDDAAALEEGTLAGEVDPASGPAATPTSSGAIAGVAAAGLGGGGGSSNPTARARDIGDKKSEFDGNPKINFAGGVMGGGSAGGGSARGGSSTIGKGVANPIASRTTIDLDSQAGRIATAAEERLRGPASNEPMGGVTSVYYLDNFSKIEKRMLTERNTLQEH
jgi:hypothetical protein